MNLVYIEHSGCGFDSAYPEARGLRSSLCAGCARVYIFVDMQFMVKEADTVDNAALLFCCRKYCMGQISKGHALKSPNQAKSRRSVAPSRTQGGELAGLQ